VSKWVTSVASALVIMVLAGAGLTADIGPNDPWYDLMDQAQTLLSQGLKDSATVMLERAVNSVRTEPGQNDTTIILVARVDGFETLYRFRDFEEAESMYTRAVSIAADISGSGSPLYATYLNKLAGIYWQWRRHDEADSLYHQALSIREDAFGPENLETAETIHDLGRLYWNQERYAEAEDHIRRALAVRERLRGPDHPEVAQTLRELAWILSNQGKMLEAEPLAIRAAGIWENSVGPEDLELNRFLAAVGYMQYALDKYEEAIVTYQRTIELIDRFPGGSPVGQVRLLTRMGQANVKLARYAAAESAYVKALDICDATLGPGHRLSEQSTWGLVQVYIARARYDEAERTALDGIAAMEAANGPVHQSVAVGYGTLGAIYSTTGRYEDAEQAYLRAMEIKEATDGPDSPNIAYNLSNLGNIHAVMGRYAEAEPLYERALAIWETHRGPDNTLVAHSLLTIAYLYDSQMRYAEAEPLYKRALEIYEGALGPNHTDLVFPLNGLAAGYERRGIYEEAEALYRRALDIEITTFGPDHPDVADAMVNLAGNYVEMERFSPAESLYVEAIGTLENVLGPENELLGGALSGLADLKFRRSDYAAAESLYGRALKNNIAGLGPEHPEVAWTLEQLSDVYRAQHRFDDALEVAGRATRIRLHNFTYNAPVLAESDAMKYANHLRSSVDNYLTCYLESGRTDPETLLEVADLVFSSKGQVSDVVFERQMSLIEETDPISLAMAENLRYTKFRLSELFVEGPTDDPDSYGTNVDSLSVRARELETELSRRSASYRKNKSNRDISTGRIASLLPENSVLMEFVRYRYRELRPERDVPHYIAIVLSREADPAVIDIGEAESIDRLIGDYRRHLLQVASSARQPTVIDQQAYDRLSQDLYAAVWEPVAEYSRESDMVLIAPDGALNLLSFAGLKDHGGAYLTESFPIHNLASGRDLIRLQEEAGPASGLFALGDPDYGAVATDRIAALGSPPGSGPADSVIQVAFATRNVRSGCGRLSEIEVAPLPGTRHEVRLISETWEATVFEPIVVRCGDEASEEYFKAEAPGKRVIHLATHGYFLGGACRPEEADIDYIGENPLLLSGLFFAGANLHGAGADSLGADDGILTAYEVSAMDLKGTELVVLSACETGLGEVSEGEGVYGLRRAFQMAGARTVVSALWPVSDEATAGMMGELYARRDEPLPQAIRRVQLERIEKLRSGGQVDHPFTWGAFIALGDWR
jgi:CHAT domain-containing protein/tetratricopeptide (TPR) repeat protein